MSTLARSLTIHPSHAPPPMVSVSVVAYNAEAFIGDTLDAILAQETDHAIEVVIGDDASTDRTRAICEGYARLHPDRVRLLPAEQNLGIAGNNQRVMNACRGRYIAICDGDDVWTDRQKLHKQIDFLERHPDHGLSYTDVTTIDTNGVPFDDPDHPGIREQYACGDVFLKLLGANFINNSTAVFRRELIADQRPDTSRGHQIPDLLRWLHITAGHKVHFLAERTVAYRRHPRSLSVGTPAHVLHGNGRALYRSLQLTLPRYDATRSGALPPQEALLLFRRACAVLWRVPGSPAEKSRSVRLAFKYMPGTRALYGLLRSKLNTAKFHTQLLLAAIIE